MCVTTTNYSTSVHFLSEVGLRLWKSRMAFSYAFHVTFALILRYWRRHAHPIYTYKRLQWSRACFFQGVDKLGMTVILVKRWCKCTWSMPVCDYANMYLLTIQNVTKNTKIQNIEKTETSSSIFLGSDVKTVSIYLETFKRVVILLWQHSNRVRKG